MNGASRQGDLPRVWCERILSSAFVGRVYVEAGGLREMAASA